MNERKLKIEVHPSNKNVGLNYSKTSTVANLKNIKIFKNLHKAKLEDRHRIKGISFSTHKKEYNNLLLYKLKKKDEATTFELSEANFLRIINDYNLLKHEIYLKELKEKKVKTKEEIDNKSLQITSLGKDKEDLIDMVKIKDRKINSLQDILNTYENNDKNQNEDDNEIDLLKVPVFTVMTTSHNV